MEKPDVAVDPASNAEPAAKGEAVAETGEGHLLALSAERDALLAEKGELRELLLRRQAEFDNFRRRTERERLESFDRATMETVRELLPILDDFERALAAESADKEYARGMELIYQRTLDALKKMGLEEFQSVGSHFDPHLHYAIDRVQTEEAEDGTILSEFQRGYNFRGSLLRPAMVKVAVR